MAGTNKLTSMESTNGIEFAATYFIMLLTLFFIGAGRYASLDHWIRRRFMPRQP
jgi:uncharacterized membrane protein YphA (DoxX/SURF4 family)